MKKDKPQSLKNRKNKQAGIDSDYNHNDFFNDDDEKWSRSKKKNKRNKPAHKNWEY
ncbi:MAG: hypothetical protein KQH63_18090 [Desulfobulbaceae bacterium]|nr:hypothetical protein [Desulfobulbaceae bacterium]